MAFDPLADLELLFADFGVEVTVGAVTTVGIWDQEFRAAQPGGGSAVVEGSSSVLLVRTATVPALEHGQTVTVGGVDYTAIGNEPDGDGLTRVEVLR